MCCCSFTEKFYQGIVLFWYRGWGGGGVVSSGDGHISFLDCPNVSTPAGYDAAISNTVSKSS